MRSTFTPPSPSDSTESFFLHDPQEVIYNRVKDIFESDTSVREEPTNRNNALTIQAEIHSSSSGANSGSDDETQEMKAKSKTYNNESKIIQASSNHDYEDIYLVREEAKTAAKKFYGRSRSRADSGSHSRSASTSSTRSHDVVLHNNNAMHFDKNSRYEVPRKNETEKMSSSQQIQSSSVINDTTYESVGPSDTVYERRNNNLAAHASNKISSPIDTPPLPPPLPPPLMKSHHNMMANANRDSNDSLDFSHVDDDSGSMESDSGLEVVEEPTLRPSELVRGNNNRSMSIISGEIFVFL